MDFRRLRFIIIFLILSIEGYSQNSSTIYGLITDTAGYPIGFANIAVSGTKYGTTANRFGQYEMQVPSDSISLVISCMGYKTIKQKVKIEPGKKMSLDFALPVAYENLEEVQIKGRSDNSGTMQRVDSRTINSIPNLTGNIETVIKSFSGVASNNELSSQYSVRGGSFDENLVYVNDIEIYRPLLIRSGEQEGLSFVNPDLVGSLKFSAGGFDASYGDKMSSVLDITYRRPTDNEGSFSASFLGGSAHYEGISKNKKFRHLSGIRYKTTQYLLSSLDTKGEYKPSFIDFQTCMSYDISPRLELSFLGNFTQNKYDFVPSNRTTDFGTFQLPLQLTVFYDGKESDLFRNALGSLTLNYHPNENLSLKSIVSLYYTSESESFDILGQYFINELDKTSDSKNDSAINIGIGSSLNHARNYLDAQILSLSHIGSLNLLINKLKWGLTFQKEIITDKLDEWNMIDSAGYALPYSTDGITLMNSSHSDNSLSSYRLMGYGMHTIELSPGNDKIYITSGLRVHYWSLNNQTIFNPRISFTYKPAWRKNLMFYFATGFYDQPAFFKELMNPQGAINTNLKAQQSIHYVLGSDYIFYAFSKPFKFTTELYYKSFKNLVPYYIDNVQTIYEGLNMGTGYATGIDFKINGEFVKGAESWFSLSIMQTMEKDLYIKGADTLVNTSYYPRPTDQRVNMGFYFQDYLPRYPSYRVHLSVHYGSRLPVTLPATNQWYNAYRILPAYKRVDIGFSKMLKGTESIVGNHNIFRPFKEVWLSAEIFNVIGIDNTASYLWVKTVSNTNDQSGYFGVPNFLTSRRFNLKLTASF
jgi:CarboxypepD_reg-like domain/TonB-dependent Receptor Plug Domain